MSYQWGAVLAVKAWCLIRGYCSQLSLDVKIFFRYCYLPTSYAACFAATVKVEQAIEWVGVVKVTGIICVEL